MFIRTGRHGSRWSWQEAERSHFQPQENEAERDKTGKEVTLNSSRHHSGELPPAILHYPIAFPKSLHQWDQVFRYGNL